MKIPVHFGLQKTSLIDYPGKVASVIFFPGCNLRCPYCHNPDLVYGRTEGLLHRNEVIEYVKFRAPLLGGVVLSGGEPLLYPDTPDFIKIIRNASGLPVKMDTNGLTPHILENLDVDYIALDFKTLPRRYAELGGDDQSSDKIRESLDILKKRNIPYEIRTTIVPQLLPLEEVAEMALYLKGVEKHMICGFKPGHCLSDAYNELPEVTKSLLKQYEEIFRQEGCSTEIR